MRVSVFLPHAAALLVSVACGSATATDFAADGQTGARGGSAGHSAVEGQGGATSNSTGGHTPSAGQGGSQQNAGGAQSVGGSNGGGGSKSVPCFRTPAPPNAKRKLIVSHAYEDGPTPGSKVPSKTFEAFDLWPEGALAKTGTTFVLNRTRYDSEIIFTPDGQLGFTVLDNRDDPLAAIGVFRISGDSIEIIEQGFNPGIDTTSLVMDPSGDRLWVLAGNVDGAIRAITIGCDGHLKAEAAPITTRLPSAMVFVPNDPRRAFLAQSSSLVGPMGGPAAPSAATLLKIDGANASVVSSVNPYTDNDGSFLDAALTPDGKYALVTDSTILDTPHNNRIAVVRLGESSVAPTQVLTWAPANGKALTEPSNVIVSAFNNSALISAGQNNDGIFYATYDPSNATAPFTITGEITYKSPPQLPSTMVQVSRGTLTGWVFVTEVEGLRQVHFRPDGPPIDAGVFPIREIGAVGVQP